MCEELDTEVERFRQRNLHRAISEELGQVDELELRDYALTQERLAGRGIKELALCLGTGIAVDTQTARDYKNFWGELPVRATVLQKPTSSWTPSPNTHGFGEVRLSGVLAACRIIATNSTGLGNSSTTSSLSCTGPDC